MPPPESSADQTTSLAALVADLRANPIARHAFDEPSRFRAILALDGVVVEVNPYNASGTAVPREQMVGRPMWEIGVYGSQPAWQQRWQARLNAALAGIGTSLYEDEFPTDEHGPYGIRGELSVVRTDAGDPLGYYVEVMNVDIVRETKEELRREVLLRKIVFEQTFQLTAILASDGTVLDVNRAIERIGVERQAILGRRIYDLGIDEPGGEERAREWLRRIELMQNATEPFRSLDVQRTEDGALRRAVDCCLTPVRSPQGRLEMILLELDDQTERYEAETRLRESEERFRGLAEALPQMVWTSDGVGDVDYFSNRWSEFTGRPVSALIGQGFRDLIHPDDRETVEAAATFRRDTKDPVVFRMRNVAGEYRWMEARMEVVTDADGTPVRTVGGTLDITERREA